MQLHIVEMSKSERSSLPPHIVSMREMSMNDWITKYGSGTLQKSRKLGFDIYDKYLEERVKFEFGFGFEILPKSYLTISDIKLVSASALTELGWHLERMIEIRPYDSDWFIGKYIQLGKDDRQGACILLKESSASWIPKGMMIFAMVAPFSDGKYLEAINPF